MAINIARRKCIIALGGAVLPWPLVVHAQQPAKLPTIGFLGAGTPSAWSRWTPVFVQRELGWIEGRTVTIEYRYGKRLDEIAAEFVRLKVNVIFTNGTPPVLAAKQATSVIPIVFASATDPVANGLVASLAQPGGNVTGLSSQTADLAGKRLELLRSVVPGLRRLAILGVAGSANSTLEMSEVQAAARTLSLEIAPFEIRRAEDIAPAFEALKGRADALYVCSSPPLTTNRIRINSLALGARLPTMHGLREFTVAGG
jgi:putative ABC transport system substrate-binding protein